MEQFQIETAQNISISQNTAHLGERMLAYLIDSFIIIAYFIVVIFILGMLSIDFRDMWALSLVLTLPAFLYYVLLETFNDGKTIGKSVVKIQVVKLDGSKPNFSSYFIRWILRIVDVVLSTGGVAVLTILIRGKGQRVGDIAAGTTVISEKRKITIKETVHTDLPEGYQATFPQVTLFKDSEMQLIKNLFNKAKRNGDHNVILSLNDQIKKVTQITTDLKPIDFVDTVIKDYSFYTEQL